jgi:glycosyltransferase involved in cell wall biosynthesis
MKKKRLLFLVTEDWYFVSHRLSLALAAKNAGFEVVVATREAKHGDLIRSSGIQIIPFELSRRSGNPVSELFRLVKLFQTEKPDIVHLVAMKPVIYGGIAARVTQVPQVVVAIAGLGWLFTSMGLLQGLVCSFLRRLMAWLLSSKNFKTIVQNPDDRTVLEKAGVSSKKLEIIKGSGVDVDHFFPIENAPSAPITVMLVARMLRDKGVREFVEAAAILKARFDKVRFVLVGDPDLANPSAIPENTLKEWNGKNGIEWWGRREDISEVLHQAHIACLPSYREGLPKSLIEAAATGLPIVTTDVPGCREVVSDGVNGFLVPPRDPRALAEALAKLIEKPDLRVKMGKLSRERALKEFSTQIVNQKILNIYQECPV